MTWDDNMASARRLIISVELRRPIGSGSGHPGAGGTLRWQAATTAAQPGNADRPAETIAGPRPKIRQVMELAQLARPNVTSGDGTRIADRRARRPSPWLSASA